MFIYFALVKIDIFIYFKIRVREEGAEKKNNLLPTGSLPRCPQWLGLDQAKVRSFFWMSLVDPGAQLTQIIFWAFPRPLAGNWIRSKAISAHLRCLPRHQPLSCNSDFLSKCLDGLGAVLLKMLVSTPCVMKHFFIQHGGSRAGDLVCFMSLLFTWRAKKGSHCLC